MNDTMQCDHCATQFPDDQMTTVEEHSLCPSCLDNETIVCTVCQERILYDSNAGDGNTILCQSCYERSYTRCDHCDRVIHDSDTYRIAADDDEVYCESCYDRTNSSRSIHDYSYRPEPIFYGAGPRFFGIELEIDKGGELSDHASRILAVGNEHEPHLYCKHDGSLHYGFELVTHPMSYEYHLGGMPWEAILRKAVELGYQSHRAGTCGLHFHVSRDAFGDTAEQQDSAIARLLYFFEKHWEELLKFSRRTEDQLSRWAARYGYKDRPKEILDHAKKGHGGGRYTCINLQNCETIEFRIFRGTLKYSTLIATLQLVNRLCDGAISMSDEEMTALSWTTFVSRQTDPELVQYLKERRLYVNEPIGGEVEL